MKKILYFFIILLSIATQAQSFMINPYGRDNAVLLNGKWNAIIDLYGRGENKKFYQNRKPESKTDFVEYAFDSGLRLNVPGDFNSQIPELKYYEGNVWYQRYFTVEKNEEGRQFIYFGAVNYKAAVWLNGIEVGRHEGGFTPFQFEVTDIVKNGENDLVVLVNNDRQVDGIPAMNFDWWNYGGITRDAFYIETPNTYISDYKIQLKKDCKDVISGYVQLDGTTTPNEIEILIPELNIYKKIAANEKGIATFEIKAKPQLWLPETPKMYDVKIINNENVIQDKLGFRTIETKGSNILLNGKPIFLKGINFHEEIPQYLGRACSDADAAMILSEVKALGCNFARTAHYPQNERLLRMAEEMGIMIWEEIPIWQGIEFTNPIILKKAETMLQEMIYRDKNRSNIIIWSIANETKPTAARDSILTKLVSFTRSLDDTRLVGAAFDNCYFNEEASTFRLQDKVTNVIDVVGINKYIGWYSPFPIEPENIKWEVAEGKPVIISEFGSEALYGQHGEADVASSWSEEYQENNYKMNIRMFKNIPNLIGISPWILFDFRSPNRYHPRNQNGWNRKGLISDKGQRKKAWYVMKQFYKEK
ncbi:beta galactosidase jelly roll domain-containing protein [Aestuariibaculum suncheonense]|uniref:Beta galactosidase jelly roll domain-containing protein n=2 Tax=Aestuariibaculum suncheonense TaxID=1028745 RepID=A0A8J6UC69_9FLAO|nr:beta galactosidase jelly roll domain-containing protein [Aestuariibaculum suncheonense]